jgi:hypothetical protein
MILNNLCRQASGLKVKTFEISIEVHDMEIRGMVGGNSTQQASRFAAAAQLALLKKLRKVRPLGINLL